MSRNCQFLSTAELAIEILCTLNSPAPGDYVAGLAIGSLGGC